MRRTRLRRKLLGVLERRGFVVIHEQGSLQVVPSERLTRTIVAAIDRARSTLVRMLRERQAPAPAYH